MVISTSGKKLIFFFLNMIASANMNLPNEITQRIIQFTAFDLQLQINHESRNVALSVINSARVKIRRVVMNYLLDWQIASTYDAMQIPKVHYKRFYPMSSRKEFIESAFDHFAMRPEYEEISDICSKGTQTEIFNQLIDYLTEDEIFTIGWQ
jgi:hypothetical protein